MAAVGVIKLGGIEKSKVYLRELVGRVKGRTGGTGYSQVDELPR